MHRAIVSLLFLLAGTSSVSAGLYCSQELLADLPSQWRGFLLDQRLLRLAAVPPKPDQQPNSVRQRYTAEADILRKAIGDRAPTADQAADLGAVLIRLGDTNRALEVLLPAWREHPDHFRLTANLATVYQLLGELGRSRELLRDSVRLAPQKHRATEELHLRLVEQRLREGRNATGLDDLFGVKYTTGELDPEQRKKLPADAVARLQALALTLPFDARLLWQLGELASVHGDPITAAAIFDGVVTEFTWPDGLLREHRRAMRVAAVELLAAGKEQHASRFKLESRSPRPLVSRIDLVPPPPIDLKGSNPLTWASVSDTLVDTRLRPTFPKRLNELDGLTATLTGYMQPLGDDLDCAAFLLIEFPIGCWLCEMPGLTGLVMVEMPEGKTQPFTREPVRVTGKWKLNRNDPESFLFQIGPATVKVEP